MRSLWLFAPVAVAACAATLSMPEPTEGAMLFADKCAICHGPAGDGVGAEITGLDPAPPDLRTIALRNGGQLDRAAVLAVIDGYTRVSFPGQVMPEFGLLLDGPLVPVDTGDGRQTPVPRQLAALLIYLESVQITE